MISLNEYRDLPTDLDVDWDVHRAVADAVHRDVY